MAKRFIRVDLSDLARDFRPIAVEPGVPLLDKSNANAKILFKWLGGLVAEPEWEGESVNFYARDDHGGRLEEVTCLPASDADLKGPLKGDLEAIRERITRAKPETSTERGVHKALIQSFAKLVDEEHRIDRDNYFFRYKDLNGRWRLVWCWGYQRIDQQPATPLVCSDPACSLFYVRRQGQNAKCPSCEAMHVVVAPVKRKSGKRRLMTGLLMFLLGAALVYWFLTREQLVAKPKQWGGPVGSRVEYTVHKPGFLGFGGEDVTQQAVALSGDPRIVRVDRYGMAALAASPGKTLVRFFLGDRSSTATLTVGPPKNPDKLIIEPANVDLGIGTTAHLKLIGQYADGSQVDLTESAYWVPNQDGVVFSYHGLVEGLIEGKTKVLARYQATPESKPMEASAQASVAKVDFKGLELGIDPLPVPLGRASKLQINAISKTDKKYSLLESSRLKLKLDPPGIAAVYGTYLEGQKLGRGRIEATWDNLTADMNFDVASAPGVNTLVVSPEQLDMVVHEIADLDVLTPSTEPIRITSANPKVVEVTKANRLVARSAGEVKVEVSQGKEKREVAVKVAPAKIRSIAVRPVHVVVPVTQSTPVKVIGQLEGDRQVELTPDVLKVEKKPATRYARFDPEAFEMRGVRPTKKPEDLAVAHQKFQAQSPVEVIMRPGVKLPPLEGEPEEVRIVSDQGPSVRVPVGAEFDDFRIEARYPDGMTQIVTNKATMTTPGSPSESPVTFSHGRILGVRPGKAVVKAEYNGVPTDTGLEVQVSAEPDLDQIRLRPAPVSILPGETVPMEAVGYDGGKSVGIINRLGDLTWKSDNPAVVGVDGPAVTGLKLGKGNVTAALGTVASEPAAVNVVESIADALVVDQPRIAMRVGEQRQIGSDVSLHRGQADLSSQVDVASSAPNVVQYDPQTHSLKATAPGVSTVTFSAGDKLATATVEVSSAIPLSGTVSVEPASGALAPGQALDLRVYVTSDQGDRMDVTDMAQWSSSAADFVQMRGNRACALAPGNAEVTVKLPSSELSGKAQVTVNNEEITEILADPASLNIAVGELAPLRILGRAASGTYEMFPNQPRLKVATGGANPQAIDVPASDLALCVDGKTPGSAEVAVNWDDRLKQQVPVTVGDNAVTDLRIEPTEATIHPGQSLTYQVTGLRNGVRELLVPGDGLTLSASNPEVARIDGLTVEGAALGTTDITAQIGQQQAKAPLNVVAGTGAPEVVTTIPGLDIPVIDEGGYYAHDGFHSHDDVYVHGHGHGHDVYVDGHHHGVDVVEDHHIPVRVGEATPRFREVQATISDQIVPDFTLNLEVSADNAAGPLEYRAYVPGQTPPDTWTPSQPSDDAQKANLQSPSIPTGPLSTWYDLILESRNPSDGSIEQCPLRFRIQGAADVKTSPDEGQPKSDKGQANPDEPGPKPDEAMPPANEKMESSEPPQSAKEAVEKTVGPFDEEK
jgi:hypothetical protein